ncbi:MAG: glutamate racemase [Candidatus Eisenbacteria bacterium]|nr:glutamate racemase [Candidatus Eisenbacteria bacterium]
MPGAPRATAPAWGAAHPAAARSDADRNAVRRRPIGVFDSGIGGLTVVGALRRCLPGEDLIYFGDAARVPYGTKSAATVTRFARESVTFLARREIKLLVVACNTASALALPALRETVAIPMLGVLEPGAAEAARQTRSGRIGVIGTAATIASGAYRRALADRDAGFEIVERPCPLFVPLAEEGWVAGEVPRQIATRYLAPLRKAQIDTLILGCTHYPLLKEVIAEAAGATVTLVDSAEATAHETATLLEARALRNPSATGGSCRVFVSDRPRRFSEIGAAFLGEPLTSVSLVDQSDLPWYER